MTSSLFVTQHFPNFLSIMYLWDGMIQGESNRDPMYQWMNVCKCIYEIGAPTRAPSELRKLFRQEKAERMVTKRDIRIIAS